MPMPGRAWLRLESLPWDSLAFRMRLSGGFRRARTPGRRRRRRPAWAVSGKKGAGPAREAPPAWPTCCQWSRSQGALRCIPFRIIRDARESLSVVDARWMPGRRAGIGRGDGVASVGGRVEMHSASGSRIRSGDRALPAQEEPTARFRSTVLRRRRTGLLGWHRSGPGTPTSTPTPGQHR